MDIDLDEHLDMEICIYFDLIPDFVLYENFEKN